MQPDGNFGSNELFRFPHIDQQFQFYENTSFSTQPYQQAPVVPEVPYYQDLALPLAPYQGASQSSQTPLRIKVPPMAPSTRSSARLHQSSDASGSEYRASDASMAVDDEAVPEEEEEEPQPKLVYKKSSRGRRVAHKSYLESGTSEDGQPEDDELNLKDGDTQNAEGDGGRDSRRTRSSLRKEKNLQDFVEDEEEDDDEDEKANRRLTRSRTKPSAPQRNGGGGRVTRSSSQRNLQPSSSRATRSSSRRTRQNPQGQEEEDAYHTEQSSGSGTHASLDEAPPTSPELDLGAVDADGEADAEGEAEDEQDGKPYALRQRQKINYAIPPPIEDIRPPPKNQHGGGRNIKRGGRAKAPGWSATGAELSRWMGAPTGDDSDSDYPTRTPRKGFGLGGLGAGGVFAGNAGGLLPGDLAAAAGTPSNLGKVGDAALADADPLGVNQNVTFDEVGGLDDHINSLKEMTLLPLLYPEVFQRFGVTPPRGVLFHGPPGTGKTLLARALAASCRTNGKSISFFMRKGADCLSKWVGEAERQLRLLFEEARNSQPSIIFFDEIDGLAPVRSSKQDQIHASIVSTLLALMDGMDGRGQVIVIGATNRPDAIDPALRRPGRFDREFFFPLPSEEARERILRIMTKKWANWDSEKGEASVKGLAKMTKGYGGADLRALCTEAALNAVQRRYPQIYKSDDRLLLQPETIEVELRDFMIAIKKLVPSSARSASSAAAPLPSQLVPLMQDSLDTMKDVISKVLPVNKKRTALEEAEYEDEGGEGALERELLLQSMESLRIYRPRVVLHGPTGMGHAYVAAAVLHHLEGFHLQSLDLGSLYSDSTRSVEAAIVQLFVEAKRHQPSVVYIPSLSGWCSAVNEVSRATVRAMLDTLAPTDPVLLLAVVDGPFSSLPRDVRAWFGTTRENRVELHHPTATQREQFFDGLLKDIQRPPNHFPDGMQRRKRVLEELPIAPPLEPRQPTAAELAVQEDNDQRVVTLLKYRLGPILTELKRKFKRFTKRAMEEYHYDFNAVPQEVEIVTSTVVETRTDADGNVNMTEQRTEEVVTQPVDGDVQVQAASQQLPPEPQLFDMDLEKMHVELYKGRYLTPEDFLDDIRKIVHNTHVRAYEDPERLYRAQAMLTAAEVSINDFDPQFRLECQRMAARERKRRDEHRRAREKEKATDDGASQPIAPRRSTRSNGPLEISITDPLKLERSLKRQRSNEAASPSEDETGDHPQKRSRIDEEDERDPLDVVGHSTSSPPRTNGVRFADTIEHMGTPQPAEVNGVEHSAQPTPNSNGGFDPSLLNPAPPLAHVDEFPLPVRTPPIEDDENPFLVREPKVETRLQPPHSVGSINGESTENRPKLPEINGDVQLSAEVQQEHLTAEQPMDVERTPTPLPDFQLDENLLSTLRDTLRDKTASLNVEQLEHLRANCLGYVWRHRSDWDRTGLLRELLDTVTTFAEEVSLDESDEEMLSPGGH